MSMPAPYCSHAALQSLQQTARTLRAAGPPCALAPLVLLHDRARTPDILALAGRLPKGSAVVYREEPGRHDPGLAQALRGVTRERGVQLLIGADAELAERVGADGVHLPRGSGLGPALRARRPEWILTRAARKDAGPEDVSGLDALLLSSVFGSRSPSAGTPLEVEAFTARVALAACPVFALGGVSAETAPSLLGSGATGVAAIDGLAALLRDPHAMPAAPNPPNKGQSTIEAKPDAAVSVSKQEGGEMVRYEASVAGKPETGELTLRRVADGVWNANHTGVPNSIGGRGVGKALVDAMAADARANGWRIIPGCPFVAAIFERKPELAQGIT